MTYNYKANYFKDEEYEIRNRSKPCQMKQEHQVMKTPSNAIKPRSFSFTVLTIKHYGVNWHQRSETSCSSMYKCLVCLS